MQSGMQNKNEYLYHLLSPGYNFWTLKKKYDDYR